MARSRSLRVSGKRNVEVWRKRRTVSAVREALTMWRISSPPPAATRTLGCGDARRAPSPARTTSLTCGCAVSGSSQSEANSSGGRFRHASSMYTGAVTMRPSPLANSRRLAFAAYPRSPAPHDLEHTPHGRRQHPYQPATLGPRQRRDLARDLGGGGGGAGRVLFGGGGGGVDGH